MMQDLSYARTSPMPGALEALNSILGSITQSQRSCIESGMPMLVARTPGPGVGQGNRPYTPREATIIPIALGAIALLVLVGLVYSRYHDAISITLVLHHIDCLEEPTMWEVHIASGGGSAAVEATAQGESAGKWSWSEIMPVSVQGYPEPSRSINLESAPSLALANRRLGCPGKLPRPCRYDSTREPPFVDGRRASTKGSRAGLSGDDFCSLRIAVLIALPDPLRTEKKVARPTTAPPLCLGLVDAWQNGV
ncbi:hypothetical protein V8D89_003093 [Ganoderma adspersum]